MKLVILPIARYKLLLDVSSRRDSLLELLLNMFSSFYAKEEIGTVLS